MIEPILVNCASRVAKETWLNQFSKTLKASRYPSHASAVSQVLTLPVSTQPTRRGQLVRQNAFDYDDGQEGLWLGSRDENQNIVEHQNQNYPQ